MVIGILYEFIGTLAILYGTAVFGWLPIVLLFIVIAKTVTLGHLNPAVTLWYYLAGKIDGQKALAYMLSQFAASIAIFKLIG
jgi:glycerol uptake facilitator-like aquaporin